MILSTSSRSNGIADTIFITTAYCKLHFGRPGSVLDCPDKWKIHKRTLGAVCLALGMLFGTPCMGAEPQTEAAKGGSQAQPAIERLVFTGDSITVGVGISADRDKNRYSSTAVRLLQEKNPQIVEINLGASGQALSDGGGASWATRILQQNPNAVVIQWGVNDHFWGHSIAQFASNYGNLVKALRQAKPTMPIVLTTLVPDYRWPENSDQWINEANGAIQEIAAVHGCQVAGVHRAFDHNRGLTADEIHPNKAGAEIMAQTIAAAFDSPPRSLKNLTVEFDRGQEVRFLKYVFKPEWSGKEPSWISISNLTPEGMDIETAVPLTVRTAPIYTTKDSYQVTISNGSDVLKLPRTTVDWTRMISFSLKPMGGTQSYKIQITPEATPKP